ncbi:uncharacterized protein LOC118437185 [Folsomia candida]|nr:uncharacterized protein LOC118437185 [Folsomia candida]
MHSANPPETYLTEENALPLLKYMVLSDAVIQEHQKVLSILTFVLTISSLTALFDGLWIEFLKEMSFSGYLLRIGTYESFPMHYAVIVNGIVGLGCSLACIIVVVRLLHHSFGLVMTTCIACAVWAFFTLVYNFGSNIIYEDKLEDIMIVEMQKSSFRNISTIWKTSQKFFKCCGISSFKNWRLEHGQRQVEVLYPSSCCVHSSKTTPCGRQEVWSGGCLESETFSVMTIAYGTLFISTFQFLFIAFTMMTLVKVYSRLRYLKKQTIEILLSETMADSVIQEEGRNEEVPFSYNQTIDVLATDKLSDKDYQIKRSSTI